MSIKKSLQSSILLTAVIPVILTGLLAYMAAATKYADVNRENALHLATDYSSGFMSQLEIQIVETSSLANTNDLRSCLLQKINSPDILLDASSGYYANIEETLLQLSESFNHEVNYFVYDVDGYLIASTVSSSASDWTEIMEKPVDSCKEITVLANSEFTAGTFDIISPVIVKNKIIGLIRTNLSMDYFTPFLSHSDGKFVIDENGSFIFNYIPDMQTDSDLLTHVNQIREDEPDSLYTEEGRGIIDFYSASTNYIYGYSYIPEYNLFYVIRQDTSNFISIVSTLPIVILLLLAIAIIFSILISQKLADKYTKPIFELNQNMDYVANGQLDVHCEVTGEDEFSTLAQNFNQMMEILSTNYSETMKARQALEDSQAELKQNYEDIEKLAYTDGLTGLYNRMAFFKYATEILSNRKEGIQNHAVIFIDLDGFKAINDTLGHDYGDLLLQSVATQLSTYIDDNDLLARNGGDEFVILRNYVESIEKLEEFLASLVSIAKHPFVLDDETVHITLSAGVSMFPQNGLSLSELMKNADIAMYTSKFSGKNSYTFFDSTMEDEINWRNDLIDILAEAVHNKEVYLLYQPQADIFTGEIIGCEALMRLNSPEVGFVSPGEFIPVAEESGLINELGEWALVEACNFNQRLIEAGFKPIRISVNVSTAQFHGDRLIRAIEELSQKTSMPLEYLEIELTESVLMTNFDHNLELINRIKELGIRIALDDFGTGYSSFSYLTQIPIDTLKIDKSFIAGICDNQNDTYIADTIIALSHHLGINVVAEGVETIEQLRILQGQKCDILQGYLFSRPIPEEDFIEFLKINS